MDYEGEDSRVAPSDTAGTSSSISPQTPPGGDAMRSPRDVVKGQHEMTYTITDTTGWRRAAIPEKREEVAEREAVYNSMDTTGWRRVAIA
eukprot:6456443-Amphidinium_carterae.3